MDSVYLTHTGLNALKRNLNTLVNDQRPQAVDALESARAKGDLSENAEYHAAREHLAAIDRQIGDLQFKLSHVDIIDENILSNEEIRILSRVNLIDMKKNTQLEYTLVDPLQADPARKLISVKSPIAQGLLGKRVGDEVEIEIPSGTLHFRVLSIERSLDL